MIRNKSTIQIISRLLMAVFLFVIISPISVYASGDSVSDNVSDEEYGSWSDAFNDSEYTDNLADIVTDYWISTWINYVGSGPDIIEDVSELLGNQYDNTKDLYENLYQYILPYSKQSIITFDPSSLTNVGKPIRNKNNLKLIHEVSKSVNNNVDTFFTEKTSDAKQKAYYQSDIFPDWFYFALSPIVDPWPNHPDPYDEPYNTTMYIGREFDSYGSPGFSYTIFHCTGNRGQLTYYGSGYGFNYNYSNNLVALSYERYKFKNGNWYDYYGTPSNYIVANGWSPASMGINWIKISGDTYIFHNTINHYFFWDQRNTTLYDLGNYNDFDDATNNGGATIIHKNNINIVNSVDFTEYNDLINQLLLDVNMSNEITNSLLIELLNEFRNQNNNFVQQDGDDIYDYIDYMMQKLLEVKDIHIEIPDISPDLDGIAEGITALLNFLASIIRTIGSIVTTLLDGLFHLFVPSETDWDEINIQFDIMTAPLGWIKEFISEAASNISILLFGRNVTDFEIPETEDAENVAAGHGSGPEASGSITATNIVFDPNGAPKIPVRFSNSTSEYFSGIEDAYIIDMSWYTPYKPVGDIIVVAFCWIFFVWRVLHGLPGIINGASVSEDIRDDAHTKVYEFFLR